LLCLLDYNTLLIANDAGNQLLERSIVVNNKIKEGNDNQQNVFDNMKILIKKIFYLNNI